MAYDRQGYDGRAQRGGQISEESRMYRADVEEEPTELDKPETDDLGEEDYEDSLELEAEDLDDEDDLGDEEEPASPLAEDAVMSKSDRRREFPSAPGSPGPVRSGGKRRKPLHRGARKTKIARA